MNSQVRTRWLLVLLAVVAVILSARQRQIASVWAQLSPSPAPSPTVPFPTPSFPTPFIPTPFGTPPGPLFTPTATPDFRIVNEIIHPLSGDAVAGFAPIVGTAVITDFVQYQVHLSSSGAENWSWLATNRKVVRNGILHVLNTYALEDGFYDLRVRALKRDGNYTEAFLRKLEVRNANPPTATPAVNELGTPQPASPLLPITPQPPTVTPTPQFRSFVENGQGIFEPRNGGILRGSVPIVGTANGKTVLNPFDRYELYVMPSGGSEWSWLSTSQQQLWQSPLFTWDTTTVEDGFYDLRLRIVYRDANYDEYYVSRLRVANQTSNSVLKQQDQVSTEKTAPGLYFPLDGVQVSGVMRIEGTTAVPDLLRWEIYWSLSGAENWQFLVSDTHPLVNGNLANLDLGLLPSGAYDFRLRIVRQDYTHTDYHVRNVQATPPTPTPLPTVPAIPG
jgi:hypothetical protein